MKKGIGKKYFPYPIHTAGYSSRERCQAWMAAP